jgi:hypothetical protein
MIVDGTVDVLGQRGLGADEGNEDDRHTRYR